VCEQSELTGALLKSVTQLRIERLRQLQQGHSGRLTLLLGGGASLAGVVTSTVGIEKLEARIGLACILVAVFGSWLKLHCDWVRMGIADKQLDAKLKRLAESESEIEETLLFSNVHSVVTRLLCASSILSDSSGGAKAEAAVGHWTQRVDDLRVSIENERTSGEWPYSEGVYDNVMSYLSINEDD
jgi:hypothetical protein